MIIIEAIEDGGIRVITDTEERIFRPRPKLFEHFFPKERIKDRHGNIHVVRASYEIYVSYVAHDEWHISLRNDERVESKYAFHKNLPMIMGESF